MTARQFHRRLSDPPSANSLVRHTLVFGAALAVMSVAILPMGMTPPRSESSSPAYVTAGVRRGGLDVTLVQRGLLDAAENIVVSSECEWSATIIDLVPEGTWVEAGDIVVELDSSEFQEQLKENEIQLIDAEAELIQAQEVLGLQKLENESGLANAQLAYVLARLDLEKYEDGEFPKLEKEAKAAVALAKEDVSRAQERYKYIARLVRKGYESPVALEQERISLLKYENQLANAERELELLVKHTYPRTMTELQAAVVETKRDLDRVETISNIALLNRQTNLHARQKKRDAALDIVQRIRKSIDACTIRTPVTGEIIYANEGSIRNEIVEGETVRRRQDVVRIPDLSQIEVDIRIHESQIEGVHQGLPATIRLDAYPNRLFTGRIVSVSRVPTQGRNYNYDLKEYDAAVRIDAAGEELIGLKPGLSAQVEILVDRRQECLSIPAQSVVEVAGRRVVFVKAATGEIEYRELEVGITNDVSVEVLSGLGESEQVLLSPRTTCSDKLMALQERFNSETDVANIGG